ncbi:hypothetical protein Tco_1517010 [Tanacetum coccineum]
MKNCGSHEPGAAFKSTRRRHTSSVPAVNIQAVSARMTSNAVLDDSFYDKPRCSFSDVASCDGCAWLKQKRLFGNEDVWVEMHRGIAWDKVENSDPQSTPQVLTSFEEYIPPVTYPKEVEKTLGTPIEVEPLNETKPEEVGLNCNHNTPLSSREVPSFDRPEPQPLLNNPSLDVSLGDVIGPEPPIKPHSPDSSRMKVVDYLTTQTPPSPHVANSHPKGMYSYCNPGIDDPKRHYGFKPGLLGKSVSLGVDISNWEMFDDDWGLESKEVSPLGEELNLFDRPNEVERGRILEARHLESILQQQISQRMAPSHHDGVYRYYHPHLNSSIGEPSLLSVK